MNRALQGGLHDSRQETGVSATKGRNTSPPPSRPPPRVPGAMGPPVSTGGVGATAAPVAADESDGYGESATSAASACLSRTLPQKTAKPYVLCVQERNGVLKGKGVWKMPTGLVNAREDITEAAVREVEEECGLAWP